MTIEFEELDFRQTPLGDISLRRRSEPMARGALVYEVKLGDEFLMSSLFTTAETALGRLGIDALPPRDLDVVVGGLGLGYTAAAVLESTAVRSLVVIDVMEAVIDWHRRGLVPLGATLTSDPRCQFLCADFFALASSPGAGFDPEMSPGPVHAVLLDIDHSPSHWLHPANSTFYTDASLDRLAAKLHPGGIFGLWSNDPPDAGFVDVLERVFDRTESRIVTFPNPYTGGESSSTVYLARTRDDSHERHGTG